MTNNNSDGNHETWTTLWNLQQMQMDGHHIIYYTYIIAELSD